MTDIIVEQSDGTTLVRFNRPQRLNAFSRSMYTALERCLADFSADSQQRVLVFTGVGRAFSSGQDLDEVGSLPREDEQTIRHNIEQLQRITRRMRATFKPMIAAINGPAVGFGAELTLGCDLRLASDNAYFMFPELERGLFFTNGTLALLPSLIGATQAARLLLTGQRLSAAEALRLGLVNEVLPAHELEGAARTLARQLIDRSASAVNLTIEGLRRTQDQAISSAMEFETSSFVRLLRDT